jgi:hypothetical protein
MDQPFGPGATVDLTLGATSASVTIAAANPVIRLLFQCGNPLGTAYLNWGAGTATATFNDFPLIANQPELVTKPPAKDTLAAVANAAGVGGVLYVTVGW